MTAALIIATAAFASIIVGTYDPRSREERQTCDRLTDLLRRTPGD